MEGDFAPKGHLAFCCQSWGMLLASSGQRPGTLLTSHNAQDRPRNRVILAKMSLVLRLTMPY